uniref:Uncharacterized protein n=1 Tax=Cucumis melo TaxID=3656 RepID=A0A9I9E9Z7_CUCME
MKWLIKTNPILKQRQLGNPKEKTNNKQLISIRFFPSTSNADNRKHQKRSNRESRRSYLRRRRQRRRRRRTIEKKKN